MRRLLSLLLVSSGAVIAGYWLRMAGGPDLRIRWLVALVLVYTAVSLAASTMQLIATRRLARLNPRYLKSQVENDPDLAEVLDDRLRERERMDWGWRAKAAAWLVVAIAATITLLPWARNGWSIRPDTPIILTDVLALGAAMLTYSLVYRRAVSAYRCGVCGGPTVQLRGESRRLSCGSCRTVWRLS